MSGHSKWSTIKRKKGATDAKRGQLFTRITRELMIAAREGGGDPETNVGLRLAVDKARAANMPKDNIERAIRRGTGEDKDANAFEESTFEGYAANGVALIIDVVTDNRNRAVADLRHVLNKHGGSLGEGGSVAWQFTRTAFFVLPVDTAEFDEIFELGVEAGADDVVEAEGYFEITAPVESYKAISDALSARGLRPEDAGLRMVPNHEIELDPATTVKVMRTIETLEDLDDVQNVYSNLAISEEALHQLEMA
ncbi:MAG TPA: YebC/PmpR family DNA-binding transcriptional regulator [Anaerolineales bacterium]|nr:YebC/PmpR family DNA-binding transcriptional regulator [Anaerolineales bacterium]